MIALAASVHVALAQAPADRRTSPDTTAGLVRLRMIDEQGNPVASVRVDVRPDSGGVLLTVYTDSAGRQTIRLASTAARYEYSARRIGYVASTGSFAVAPRAAIDVAVTLTHAVQQLDAVRTTARENLMSYSITSDQIASSGRNDQNAYNVLSRSRLNMFGDKMRGCPYVRYIWINGQRLALAPWEAVIPLQSTRVEVPMPHSPPNSPLTLIKPQHIAEIRYVNCWDSTVPNSPFYHNALFVSLKSGIGFDFRRGSYVVDSVSARAAGVIP
jgi:hypothetical protein